MTLEELAARTGLSTRVLRYFVRHQLLCTPVIGTRWQPRALVDTPELRAWIEKREWEDG